MISARRLVGGGAAAVLLAGAKAAESASSAQSTETAKVVGSTSSTNAAGAADPPPFSLAAPSRFDIETYFGRARHFVDMLGDLRTLFIGHAAIAEHRAQLDAWVAGRNLADVDDEALWHARKVVQATCHPSTGEVIPAPLRFSAFAPANLVICAGMLRPNPTLVHSAFWQWVNQSYNALVNHANRADAGEVDSEAPGEFMGAYAAATASALAICVGLQEGARRLSGGTTRSATLVRLTVPMLSVAVAANVNLVLMRRLELVEGVEVTTAEGCSLGHSQIAARQALLECAITRAVWTFLLLTATPLCASAAFAALPSRLSQLATARTVVELSVSFGVIWLSVPLAIALFPQRESMALEQLETQVQRAAPEGYAGAAWFNRGL